MAISISRHQPCTHLDIDFSIEATIPSPLRTRHTRSSAKKSGLNKLKHTRSTGGFISRKSVKSAFAVDNPKNPLYIEVVIICPPGN